MIQKDTAHLIASSLHQELQLLILTHNMLEMDPILAEMGLLKAVAIHQKASPYRSRWRVVVEAMRLFPDWDFPEMAMPEPWQTAEQT